MSQTHKERDFRFDAVNHKYYLDGKLSPGVTSILDANGYISPWAKKNEVARQKGSDIHKITQYIDQGILAGLPDRYNWVTKVWNEFIEREGLEFEYIETALYDRERGLWCGMLDRAGYTAEGERRLWDIYTGKKFPRYKHIQMVPYRILLAQIAPEYADAPREGIVIQPDGVHRVPCPDEEADTGAWWSCLNNFWYKQNYCGEKLLEAA